MEELQAVKSPNQTAMLACNGWLFMNECRLPQHSQSQQTFHGAPEDMSQGCESPHALPPTNAALRPRLFVISSPRKATKSSSPSARNRAHSLQQDTGIAMRHRGSLIPKCIACNMWTSTTYPISVPDLACKVIERFQATL